MDCKTTRSDCLGIQLMAISASIAASGPLHKLTLNVQHAPAPLAHGPLLVPPLRSHSLADKQVPDSFPSPRQAVFWNLIIVACCWNPPNRGRPNIPCAWAQLETINIVARSQRTTFARDIWLAWCSLIGRCRTLTIF